MTSVAWRCTVPVELVLNFWISQLGGFYGYFLALNTSVFPEIVLGFVSCTYRDLLFNRHSFGKTMNIGMCLCEYMN